MSFVEHSISLDIKTPRSVEPIQLLTTNLSAYSISARITEDGREVDLSQYDSVKLKLDGYEPNDYPSGSIVGNRAVFSLAGLTIEEGWTVCSVLLSSDSTDVNTQVFQIFKHGHTTIQVDETPFLSLSQEQLLKIASLAEVMESADETALSQITLADVMKLKSTELITNVTDDPDRANGGSRIANGVLHVTPKISDVTVNGASKLQDGSVGIVSSDLFNNINILSDNGYSDEVGRAEITGGDLNIYIDNGVEGVTLNGETVEAESDPETHKNIIPLNALKGIKVGSSYLDATDAMGRVELIPGTGISFAPDRNNRLTIAFDQTNLTFDADKLTIPSGAQNGDALIVENGQLVFADLAEALGLIVGEDGISLVTNITQSFDFDDFATVTSVADTDTLPFLKGTSGTKITWANLMSQFAEKHRNEYFTKTINGSAWGASQTCSVHISESELNEKNLTAEQVIDTSGSNHTHAHIHPEPDYVYDYSNYGIYCTGAMIQNGGVSFTFARNTQIRNMPNVDVTIEVRLG